MQIQITPELEENLSSISSSKIYFGHQSVGANILSGVEDIIALSNHNNIHIINLHHTSEQPESYLAHSYIGKNADSKSKCSDFAETVNKFFPKGLDFAMLKFCFVDIRRENNPREIFELYKATIDSLKLKYPNTTFIHFTVPLTSHNVNFYLKMRRLIKKIVGRRDYSPLDNVKRQEYNNLIREHYKDEPIFDISKIESTYPDGGREFFEYEGKEYESLIFDYSTDAGHLNKIGQHRAALELINVLAQAKNKKTNLVLKFY